MPRDKVRDALNERARQETYRREIFSLLSDDKGQTYCVNCREDDLRCLQIDHIGGGGKHNKKPGNFYFKILESLRAGSKDYQILCANCNWIKRHENNENNQRKYYR